MSDRFATVINCIDGRTHARVLDQVQLRFGTKNLDLITRPGAVRFLTDPADPVAETIIQDVGISVDRHASQRLAIVAHSDCAGNPVPDARQKEQLKTARAVLDQRFTGMEVIALFLDLKTGFEQVR